MLPGDHPDHWLFDQCLAYALARICASAPAIAGGLQKNGCHGRGYDEEEQSLRQMAASTDVVTLKKLFVGTSVCAKEPLASLLRSHDVTTHGFFKRVFGSCPPDKVLCVWSEALDVNQHATLAMTKYETAAEFVSDVGRIVKWFAAKRRPGRVLTRKPTEEPRGVSGSRTSGPLCGASAKKTVLDIIHEPLLSSLIQCGDVHRLFAEIGLRVPTGTTIVEQGFSAMSSVLFEKSQRFVSPSTFRGHSMLTTLLLKMGSVQEYAVPPAVILALLQRLHIVPKNRNSCAHCCIGAVALLVRRSCGSMRIRLLQSTFTQMARLRTRREHKCAGCGFTAKTERPRCGDKPMFEPFGPVRVWKGEAFYIGATIAPNNTVEMQGGIEAIFWLNSYAEHGTLNPEDDVLFTVETLCVEELIDDNFSAGENRVLENVAG